MSLPQHFPHEREEEPEGTEASAPAPDAFSGSLHEAILNEAPVTTLEELLAAGAEVDAVDSLGETPLWLAVTLGARDAVEVLLRAGADPWEIGRASCRESVQMRTVADALTQHRDR